MLAVQNTALQNGRKLQKDFKSDVQQKCSRHVELNLSPPFGLLLCILYCFFFFVFEKGILYSCSLYKCNISPLYWCITDFSYYIYMMGKMS